MTSGNFSLDIIIKFAVYQKKNHEKIFYLVKGILFYLFFVLFNNNKSKESVTINQAGDDIYPLF